jgi:hypothetical protein
MYVFISKERSSKGALTALMGRRNILYTTRIHTVQYFLFACSLHKDEALERVNFPPKEKGLFHSGSQTLDCLIIGSKISSKDPSTECSRGLS